MMQLGRDLQTRNNGSKPHLPLPNFLDLVLSGTYLSTMEGWKAELTQQGEDVRRSDNMTSTENWSGVIRMVEQQFTHFATAA